MSDASLVGTNARSTSGAGSDVFNGTLVFEEPSIGLHPADVTTLLGVFDHLVQHGATLIVIDHDLDLIANADWVLDMGPGGGTRGGRSLFAGSVEELLARGAEDGIEAWLRGHLGRQGGESAVCMPLAT